MENRTIASLLVIAILVSAGAGFLAGSQLTSSKTTLQSSASSSKWKFVVRIDATVVHAGQSLLLMASLTNTSPSNQTIRPYVQPFVNPSVIATNGKEVWAWDPLVVTWPNTNVTSGQSLSQQVSIPTANFPVGEYTVEIAPLSSQFSENFSLSMPFSVL
jgi:outer membrane lipoprotein-sorting protein